MSMLERGNEGGASLASSPPGGSLSGGGDQSPRREEEPSEGKDTSLLFVCNVTQRTENE